MLLFIWVLILMIMIGTNFITKILLKGNVMNARNFVSSNESAYQAYRVHIEDVYFV